MPLRSFRFYLSGNLHYYGHIRLPRQLADFTGPVRVSHVHALPLCCTQHHPTPGICWFAFYRCFNQHHRFHQLWKTDRYLSVTKPN